MTQPQWTPGVCNDRAGFLFSHECGEASVFNCGNCGKPVCHAHAHQSASGTVCTSCARGEIAKIQPPRDTSGKPPVQPAGQPYGQQVGFQPQQTQYHSNYGYYHPYFYSGYYYPGYGYYGPGYWGHSHYSTVHHYGHSGHDPNDFHEGDARNLSHEGDADFERDFGES